MQAELVVGIDVHKHELVVAADDPATPVATYPNTSPGRQQVIAVLAQQPIRLVVMEASGGQERALLQDLWEAGIPVCRANARRMRDFARATGLLAKTDDLDARLLARAGRQLELTPQPMPSTEQQELADLQAYRRRLVADGVAISNRLGQATHPVIVASLQRQLASIAAERTAIEAEMNRVLADCAALQARVEILESVPGIGPRTARLLVAALPELGQATSQEIAALAGVAPMNHDSGLYRGRRRIRGGRPEVRAGLYMAAMAAMTHNPVCTALAERLRAKGKPGLVVMVAVMRKVLVLANAMLRDGTFWEQTRAAQTAQHP